MEGHFQKNRRMRSPDPDNMDGRGKRKRKQESKPESKCLLGSSVASWSHCHAETDADFREELAALSHLSGLSEVGEEPRLDASNKSDYCKLEAWREFVQHVYKQVLYHQRQYLLTVDSFPVAAIYLVEVANWFVRRQVTEIEAAEKDPALAFMSPFRWSSALVIPFYD